MLGQPVSMLIPQVVGFRLHGKLREGATATDLVLTVTADAAQDAAWSGSSSSSSAPGVGGAAARRPRHHRQHGARVRRHLRHLPGRRRDAALPALHRPPRGAGRAGRGVREGAGAVPRPPATPEADYIRRASSSTSAPSSRASPARAARRTASPARRAGKSFEDALPSCCRRPRRKPRTDEPAVASSRPAGRPASGSRRSAHGVRRHRARLGGDRGDHQLHQHVEPVGDDGRRPARQEGGRARAQRPSPG